MLPSVQFCFHDSPASTLPVWIVAGETHTFTLYTDGTAADVNEATEM